MDITERFNDMQLNKRSSEVDFMEQHQLNMRSNLDQRVGSISDVTSKSHHVSLVCDPLARQVLELPGSHNVTPLHFNDPDFSERLGEAVLREIEADPVMFEQYKRFMEGGEDCPKSLLGYHVPMSNEKELDIWRKFQELHKRKVPKEPGSININDDKMLIDPNQPIIRCLVNFAVETFNEICQKDGVSEGVHTVNIVDVKYLRGPEFYVFYITLVTEKGPYLALVVIYPDDTKTLMEFCHPTPFSAVEEKSKKAAEGKERSKQSCEAGKVKEKSKKAAEGEEILKQSCEARKGKRKFNKAGKKKFNKAALMDEICDILRRLKGKRTALTGELTSIEIAKYAKYAKKRAMLELEKKAKEAADSCAGRGMKAPSCGSGLYADPVRGRYVYTIPSAEDLEHFWF